MFHWIETYVRFIVFEYMLQRCFYFFVIKFQKFERYGIESIFYIFYYKRNKIWRKFDSTIFQFDISRARNVTLNYIYFYLGIFRMKYESEM